MDRDVAWDIEREALWKDNEAKGLVNPRCFADVGEGCYMESLTCHTLQHLEDGDIPENCEGCRGYGWLQEERRAEATS